MNRPRRLPALLLSLLALAACGSKHDAAGTSNDVLRNLSLEVISPAYVQLDEATDALKSSTSQLCEKPSPQARRAAQEAWVDAWQAWNRTRAFRFGPLTDNRATADIAFMVDPKKIDKLLATANPKTIPAFTASSLSEMGADVRGLAAIEHLLFERNPLDAPVCAFAAAAAELTAISAHQVRVGWTEASGHSPPFRDQFAEPPSETNGSARPGTSDLVNGISMALTEASRQLANAEAAPPGERETTGSHGGRALQDMLWSVRAIYFGATSGTEGDGVSDLVASVSPTADRRVRDLLERADASLVDVPTSLEDASADELTRAYKIVRNAGTIVRAEVAGELGVTLSLGDADGDS